MKAQSFRRLGAASVLLAALLVLTFGFLPARGAVDEFTGLYGGDLRVAVPGTIDLNPFTATDEASWNAIPLVYDSIARIGYVDLVPEPWAASAWSISDSTLTVTLRDDLTFHDGSALSADDVVYSYNEYKTLGMVPADLTVSGSGTEVTLASTAGGGLLFGNSLTLPIVKDGTASDPVGSGPYVPTSTTMPVVLDRNADHFWSPFLSSVTLSAYADTAAASEALLRGNVDVIGWTLSVDDPSAIIDIDGQNMSLLNDARIHNNPGLEHLTVGFNVASGRLTDDDDLRMALAETLNPILYGQIHPATDRSRSLIINENTPWYNPDVPVYQVIITVVGGRSTALLESSNQLLDGAGYLDRNGDGVREMPDGSSFQLNLVGIPVGENVRVFAVQNAILDLFTRIGLDVSMEVVPKADIPARLATGDFDIFVANLGTSLDPEFLRDYYHSSGSLNYVAYDSTAVDSALAAADAAIALADRQAEVDLIQQTVMEDAVLVPVLHFDAIDATVRGFFEGWVNMPGGINNFWTYLNLRVTQIGPLAASLSVVPVSTTSGGDVTALVTTTDQDGAAVADVSVSILADGVEVATGTSDATGSLSLSFAAPAVSGITDVEITAEAIRPGYVGARDSAYVTVRPVVGVLVVSVASDAVSIGPDDSASITVTVRDGTGTAVSGAAVSLNLIGNGGTLDDLDGATGSAGTFTTTFTADVGVRTLFQIEATASLSGFTDDTGSTSVLAEQRVGEAEPRSPPFFDIGAIIAAIVILVIIVVVVALRRR